MSFSLRINLSYALTAPVVAAAAAAVVAGEVAVAIEQSRATQPSSCSCVLRPCAMRMCEKPISRMKSSFWGSGISCARVTYHDRKRQHHHIRDCGVMGVIGFPPIAHMGGLCGEHYAVVTLANIYRKKQS